MYGHYIRHLDDKKRIVLPKVLKKDLGLAFYATIGPDNVLELRAEKSFSLWRDKLLSPNMLNANARKFARVLLGNTIEVILDQQNRMLIPELFINRLHLTKEVAFVGVGNKVELWPKKAFDDFQNQNQGQNALENLAKKLLADGVEI